MSDLASDEYLPRDQRRQQHQIIPSSWDGSTRRGAGQSAGQHAPAQLDWLANLNPFRREWGFFSFAYTDGQTGNSSEITRGALVMESGLISMIPADDDDDDLSGATFAYNLLAHGC